MSTIPQLSIFIPKIQPKTLYNNIIDAFFFVNIRSCQSSKLMSTSAATIIYCHILGMFENVLTSKYLGDYVYVTYTMSQEPNSDVPNAS